MSKHVTNKRLWRAVTSSQEPQKDDPKTRMVIEVGKGRSTTTSQFKWAVASYVNNQGHVLLPHKQVLQDSYTERELWLRPHEAFLRRRRHNSSKSPHNLALLRRLEAECRQELGENDLCISHSQSMLQFANTNTGDSTYSFRAVRT